MSPHPWLPTENFLQFHVLPLKDAIILKLYSLIPVKKFYERKIEIIFLPINLNICFGSQKNRLIETVLLSTHNICFG